MDTINGSSSASKIDVSNERPRCRFWLVKKHKYCTQIVPSLKSETEGENIYCTVHAKLIETTGCSAAMPELTRKEDKRRRRRILRANDTQPSLDILECNNEKRDRESYNLICPFFPSHSVLPSKFEEHLKTCPYRTRKTTVLPSEGTQLSPTGVPLYFNPDYNKSRCCPSDSDASSTGAFQRLETKEQNEFLEWLDKTYETFKIEEEICIFPTCASGVSASGISPDGSDAKTHPFCTIFQSINPLLENTLNRMGTRKSTQYRGMLEAVFSEWGRNSRAANGKSLLSPTSVLGLMELGAGKGGMLSVFSCAADGDPLKRIGENVKGCGDSRVTSSEECTYEKRNGMEKLAESFDEETLGLAHGVLKQLEFNRKYGTPTVAIDMSFFRDMRDKELERRTTFRERTLQGLSPRHVRIRMNLKDLCLPALLRSSPSFFWKINEVNATLDYPPTEWMFIGKHLCGGCTDMALRGVASAIKDTDSALNGDVRDVFGIAIAPCCHHCCTADVFVSTSNGEWKKGVFSLTPRELALCSSISSWGTSIGRAKGNQEMELGVEKQNYKKYNWGRKAKRLIDYSRVSWLRELKKNGIPYFTDVKMNQYCDSAVSEENIIITAFRNAS